VLEQQMHAVKGCVSVLSDPSQCKERPMDALDSKATDAPGMLPLPFVKGNALLDHSVRGPSEAQYELMRERVRVLSSSNPRSVLDYYTRNMANARFAASTSNRYGYALALLQLNQAAKAVPVMQKLVDASPGDLTLALGLADAERHAGQRNQALQRYAALNSTWPNDPAIVLD
jgi:hypothetical protein